MPDIFVKNSGPQRLNLTLSSEDKGEHAIDPGAQAKITCADEEHATGVGAWLDRYGMEHCTEAFRDCGEPTVIEPKPPKKEG
jgi:hypothetical protein